MTKTSIIKKFTASVSLLAFVAACTVPSSTSDLNVFLSRLNNTAIADLQNADAIAVSTGDTLAHQCYPVLLAVDAQAVAFVASQEGKTIGVFTAAEYARTLAPNGQVVNGIMMQLEQGCAAFLADEQRLLNQQLTGFNLGALAGVVKLAPLAAGA